MIFDIIIITATFNLLILTLYLSDRGQSSPMWSGLILSFHRSTNYAIPQMQRASYLFARLVVFLGLRQPLILQSFKTIFHIARGIVVPLSPPSPQITKLAGDQKGYPRGPYRLSKIHKPSTAIGGLGHMNTHRMGFLSHQPDVFKKPMEISGNLEYKACRGNGLPGANRLTEN